MAVKVYYFQMTGLGEPVRLLLAASDIDFEDKRVTKEEWAEMKPTLRWGQLPLVEIDGRSLTQGRSICRYIARRNNLVGSDEDEATLADITVDNLDDMRQKITDFYYSPDSPARDEGLHNGKTTVIPFYMKKFEQQLDENNGYLVGGKLTWADIVFLAYIDYLGQLLEEDDLLEDFPKLKQYVENIKELPGIKKYLATRPEQVKDLRELFS